MNVAYADRVECEIRLREAAPRLRIGFSAIDEPQGKVDEGIDPHNVSGTVRDYIERHYANDPRKPLLLAGFARLLEEVKP